MVRRHVNLECPHCGHEWRGRARDVGRRDRCPSCQDEVAFRQAPGGSRASSGRGGFLLFLVGFLLAGAPLSTMLAIEMTRGKDREEKLERLAKSRQIAERAESQRTEKIRNLENEVKHLEAQRAQSQAMRSAMERELTVRSEMVERLERRCTDLEKRLGGE
jgi:septal ring factor EnvC (AmiA/AmiB activator)